MYFYTKWGNHFSGVGWGVDFFLLFPRQCNVLTVSSEFTWYWGYRLPKCDLIEWRKNRVYILFTEDLSIADFDTMGKRYWGPNWSAHIKDDCTKKMLTFFLFRWVYNVLKIFFNFLTFFYYLSISYMHIMCFDTALPHPLQLSIPYSAFSPLFLPNLMCSF